MKILNAVILPPYFFSCVFFTFVLSLRQKDKEIAVEKKKFVISSLKYRTYSMHVLMVHDSWTVRIFY